MKNQTKVKRNIFMLIIMFSSIILPVFSQSTSGDFTDLSSENLITDFIPLENVKGFGKVVCELRVPPSLVSSFDSLLSGGTVLSDGSKVFNLRPKDDTITLRDKLDDQGNPISGQNTIAFRTRDFVRTSESQTNPDFFVDSVASYDISRDNLKKTLLGSLASGDVSFNFLAWKGTADVAQSYKVTNSSDMSFAVARITGVQPVTYINSDGTKVKTAALSGRLKVSTDVNFLARKKYRFIHSNQTTLNTGKIVLDCMLTRCVLDKTKNIDLVNKIIENCSNVLFSGGTIVPTQTETGILVPQCVCGDGQSLGLEGGLSGDATCCDTNLTTTTKNASGVDIIICPATAPSIPSVASTPTPTPSATVVPTSTPSASPIQSSTPLPVSSPSASPTPTSTP